MMERYKVGILGATGLVGQQLILRLAGHPWFEIAGLGASRSSADRAYAEAVRWGLGAEPPAGVAGMKLRRCVADAFDECDLVFSAIDAEAAREIEPEFADAGMAVISNSSAYRQANDVPLLVPEVNAGHVALLDRKRAAGRGYIVTNPNCSVTGLAVAIAPLHRTFGVRRLVVATLQAVSGAGMDGPRAMELMGNVLPYIRGEEEKMESELAKILGSESGGRLERAEFPVSAHCHRVAVRDGHLEAISVELGRPVTPEDAVRALRGFRGDVAGLDLPSAPAEPLIVRDEPDRPQPLLDRNAGGGMSVVVGRVRACPVLGLKLVLLSHNTVRGAAGGTVLNAELLAAKELLPRRGSV